MIRIIIERHVKEGKKGELISRLRELRTKAMHQPGYITGETLVSTEDSSKITVISTWNSLESWKTWYKSEPRRTICQSVAPLLTEESRVSTYEVAAT